MFKHILIIISTEIMHIYKIVNFSIVGNDDGGKLMSDK